MRQLLPRVVLFYTLLLFFALQAVGQGSGCKATMRADNALTFCKGQTTRLSVDQKGHTYTWYKDGQEITGQKGEFYTVSASGSYTVRIDNHASCAPASTLSDPMKITVEEYPVADFSAPSGDQCAGNAVSFTNASTGNALKYSWDFGDPDAGARNSSTEASPKHVYKGFIGQSKVFTVRLTVTNSAGCERTVEKKVTVKEGPDATLLDVDAGAINTPFVQCSSSSSDINYTVTAQNNSTTQSLNQGYAINWGDGSPVENLGSDFTKVTHTYTRRGAFKLVFTVTGNGGCSSSTTYEAYNGSNPSLAVGSPGNTVGCAPVTYTFPISGVADNSPATKYTFQFNDNTPAYTFTQENIPASITHTFNQGSCGMTGDAFTLTASAENPCGKTPITVGSIKIASGPKAAFAVPAQAVCTNQLVSLQNTTVNGSAFTNTGACSSASNSSWSVSPAAGWGFASGSTSATENPVFTFTKPGTYEVTLTSSNGCTTASFTKEIRVITPPAAAFSLTAEEGCSPLRVGTANASTGDELRYKWTVSPDRGYTLASGSLTSIDPVFNFTEGGDYVLTLKAVNGCDSSTTSQPVKVRGKPLVTLPEAKGYCTPLTLKFDASDPSHTPNFTVGNGTISGYAWQVSGEATFVNGTTASSQFPAIHFPKEGSYTVTLKATNACGDSEAATQTITIAPAVENSISADQTVCAGSIPAPLTEAVPTNGQGGNLIYTWEFSTTDATTGFQPIAGAAASSFAPQALTQTTWFRRIINAGGCEVQSNTVQITVTPTPPAPSLAGTTVCAGTIVVLKVDSPNGATYEWFTDKTGDTPVHEGASYETPVLQATTTYYVQTKGTQSCPSVRVAVTVTVNPLVENNTISADQAICTGETPQDLIGSEPTGGTGVFSYVWEQSTDNQTYTPAEGVRASRDYEPGPLQQETWFRRRVVSGSCESVSAPVQVVVNGMITNNTISAPQVICTGSEPIALSGSVPAGGDGSYAYRWEMSTDGPTGIFQPVPGDNENAGYNPGILSQTTWFRRVVLSSICANPSAAVEITVHETIGNNLLTEDQTLCLGNTGTLKGSMPTGGSGSYTFLWEVSTLSDMEGFVPAPGLGTEQEYTTAALTQTSWFRRRVSSGPCAAHYSAPVKITVNSAITLNTITGAQNVCAGTAPLLLAGSTPSGGSGSYTYLWEASTAGPDTGFSPATGSNNAESYQPEALTQTTWFRRSVLSVPCAPVASNAIEVSVLPVISGNLLEGTQTICTGATPRLLTGTTPTGGSGSYTYRWEMSIDGLVFETATGNAAQASYQAGALGQTTWFRRIVNSGECVDTSVPVLVTVNEEISGNSISQDQLLCVGATPAALSGTDPAGGDGNYTYRWESSTLGPDTGYEPAAGSNTASQYAPGAIRQTTWFRRVVSAGPCAENSSLPVKITVTPPIADNAISMPQAICEGVLPAPLSGTTPSGGNGTYTYVWESSTTSAQGGFAAAAGINDRMGYTPGQTTATTWYRRVVYSEGCTSVSGAVQITVVSPVANNNISADQVVCLGTAPAALLGTTPIGGDGAYAYRWEISTDNMGYTLAPGITDEANYTPNPLSADTWFRRVVMAGPCAASVSSPVKITVNAPVSNNTIGSPQLVCAGTTPGVLHGAAPVGGTGSYTFLWEASTNSATAGFAPAPGDNSGISYAPEALQRTTWFRRKVISLPCQENISSTVLVTVQPQPKLPQAKGGRICPGETITLTASALEITDRLEWYDQQEGGIALYTGSSFTSPPLLATTAYYVQAVNTYGCASERLEVVATVLAPEADAGPDITIVAGRKAQLRARGGETYVWSPADGLSSAIIPDPEAAPAQTTTYTVTITTAEGCVVTDEVTVTVLPRISITNALTLNGDGLNETWFIENIEHYPNCQVQVFTRWGAKVFESEGYRQPWDGTYQGKQLPMAAYYYVIRLDKTSDPISGSITLIK
ncbi:PKD domain-containing protein [Pontibacter sp. E15-1]|uniref:gliding motility-associated C-terminal domain-containing protein n=1 Tax=Pontibacter sp. E15-1 TaxID=2919918 RepID=UPI001F4FD362|nr:gliding motility-associated C-terminal domain-containing protein [Pontibacter sp. E15-1]MCJ8164138.1 PKD domain-containing protein [Pontibacter sp. E15-1]